VVLPAETSPLAISEDPTVPLSLLQMVSAGSEQEEEEEVKQEEEEEVKQEEEEEDKQAQKEEQQKEEEQSKIKEICNDGIDNDEDGDVDLEDSDCEDEEEKDKPLTDSVATTETTITGANNVGETEPTNDNQTPTTTADAEDSSSNGGANNTNTSSSAPPSHGLLGFTAGTQPLNGNTYNIEGTGTTIQYPPDFTPILGVALNNENTVDTDVVFTKKTATNTIEYGVSVWNINDFKPEIKEKYDTPEEIYESLLNYPHRSNKVIVSDIISEPTWVLGKPGGKSIEYKYNWCLKDLCPPAIPYQEKIRQEYRVEGNTIYLTTYRVSQGIQDNLADIDTSPQTKSAFDLYRVNAGQIGASFKSVVSPPPPPPPPPSKETICDDGKDNDADGLVDAADPDCLKIPPPPANAPQAIAAVDKTTAKVGEAVQLDGSGSTDSAGGTNLDYQWTQTSGKSKPTFSTTDPKPKLIVPAIPDGTPRDTLTFQLTVNDKGNAVAKSQPSDPVTVTVTVQPAVSTNNPPVAKGTASPSTVNEGGTVKLDASQSTDSDIGDTLTYLWSQTAPPTPIVGLSSATAISPTFKAPDVSSDTPFTFILTVKDKAGLTSNTNIPIKVTNAKPFSEPGGGGGSTSGSSAGTTTGGGTTTGDDAGLLEDNGTSESTTDILDGNFSLYEDPALEFKIQYPSNWIKLATGNAKIPVIFTVPQPNGTTTGQQEQEQQSGVSTIELPNLLVNVENVSSNNIVTPSSQQQDTLASMDPLLHGFAINQTTNLFNSKSTLFQLLESNSTASLANNSAYKLVYNGTKIDDSTTKVKGFNIFTIKDGKAYSLLYLAKAEEYDKYLPLIENMIDSFQITDNNSSPISNSIGNDNDR
jgi:hypothetical protein